MRLIDVKRRKPSEPWERTRVFGVRCSELQSAETGMHRDITFRNLRYYGHTTTILMLLLMSLPRSVSLQVPPTSPPCHHCSTPNPEKSRGRLHALAPASRGCLHSSPMPHDDDGGNASAMGHSLETEFRDCVIVGGGIAGLAAARDLEAVGLDFVILEADGRLGGRIHTYAKSQGQESRARPLELGAQWLHGTKGNSLFDFCVEEGIFDSEEGRANLAMAENPQFSSAFEARTADGREVPTKEFRRVSKAWSQAVLDAEKLGMACVLKEQEDTEHGADKVTKTTTTTTSAHHQHTAREENFDCRTLGDQDNRVGEFLTRRVHELLREGFGDGERGQRECVPGGSDDRTSEPDAGVLGYLERLQCTVDGCDDLRDVSLTGYGAYGELEGGNVRVPGGFSRVTDALARKISEERIRLNCAVSLVHWANRKYAATQSGIDDVNVNVNGTTKMRYYIHTADGGGGNDDGVGVGDGGSYPCAVEYRTKGESDSGYYTKRIECRHVVLTVGLGVLKDGGAIKFVPPLPSTKLDAIRRLGFGTADKVFLRCTHDEDAAESPRGKKEDRERVKPSKRAHEASLHIGVLRPISESGALLGDRLVDRTPSLPEGQWLKDVYSLTVEGDCVYSWLTGASARAVELAPALQVQEGLLSLLRSVTKNASWRAEGELVVSNDDTSQHQEEQQHHYHHHRQHQQQKKQQRKQQKNQQQFRSSTTGDKSETRTTPTTPTTIPPLVRSTWNSNPLFRGSYSYIATGSSPADIEELAVPLTWHSPSPGTAGVAGGDRHGEEQPRVFFAGEATHPVFFSTAHGGFESGRRAAEAVLRYLSLSPSPRQAPPSK